MAFREKTIRFLNKLFPIKVKGDAIIPDTETEYQLSCIINFYKRPQLLKNILSGLSEQNIDKNIFEVVMVEDRGGSEEGQRIVDEFRDKININYHPLDKNFGVMGYSRNFGINKSRGKYLLFLDDDTIILKIDFLKNLLNIFENEKTDVMLPKGISSYCIIKDQYQFHDPYFPTNRCTAYTRETIKELGGFISDFIGQEDVEITVRLIISGKKIMKTNKIQYLHPPLIYSSFNKSASVGYSFASLYNKYPFIIWSFLLINGCRYLPLIFFPVTKKIRNKITFSIGFLIGIINKLFKRKTGYNN